MRTVRTTVLAATAAALALTAGGAAVATAAPAAKSATTATHQCGVNDLAYSVLHRFPQQQGEHLLITARNNGSQACWVTSLPSVTLGKTTNVLPHSTKDAPGGKDRITVQPGGKVYSAVALFAGIGQEHTASTLSLALRDQAGHGGAATTLTSRNAKGATSKFTWSEADVLNWNKQKPYDF
ncbi:hypothetical protein C3486_19885 [Streptomyces sp. Ru73]|uniref:DUF4232 domain-containing protein n=1 Tax=Streptomyces sp. Ru73 TaxID=2080748 RepID=UPI000CDCFB37|nr:DUF4232 domain-containing protein [Streptomyces sp. Ru73]POX39127.1 hypothetical protein C3486_19885 [Streptomyces sp. Ru73]